jgi:CheY-like chemotaxis protein
MIVERPQAYGRGLPPALLSDLTVVLRNSRHLASLINDVLDLSQIEARQMALTKERVALPELIQEAVDAVRPLFESKSLYLQTALAPDLPLVSCDRTRIREVLLNLLSNAGRFTESGGVVVSAHKSGAEVVVSVADTGPGIAPGDADKVFQPFRQLDGTIRRRHGGSGLGLSISKSFVELHGGQMGLESAPDAGTTFFFSLPLETPASGEASAGRWLNPDWPFLERTRRSLAPLPQVRPRIVVLESGHALHRLLERYMDLAEVVPAASFDDALAALSAVPAHALLINEVSGREHVQDTLGRIAECGGLPYDAPAIICSVPGMPEAASALGVAAYLVKPVAAEALLATLESLGVMAGTIVVADDEPDARRLFWRMLSSAGRGYRVLTAANGREALDLLQAEHPAAVLLDLVMPELDGWQLLAARDADPTLRPIPFLITSARDPTGEPIVSDALTVTRGGGLSLPQLLSCIEAVTAILSPVKQRNQAPSEESELEPAPDR